MPTIKDVAAKAGVSISTVSYAISGERPISVEKKALIEQAMKELDYRPHAIARSLASKRTRIIALLFPPVERGIGLSELSLITNAAMAATEQGYHLVLWSLVSKDPDELRHLIRQELVDGVILMEVHDNDFRIPILREQRIPFFLFGQDSSAPDENFVDTDFIVSMYRALAFLSGLGHREICFINQSHDAFQSGYGPVVRSHAAFERFSVELKISGRECFCNSDPATGFRTAAEVLEQRPATTAFLVMNDRCLSGVIKAIEKKGRTIPGDLSLIAHVSSAATATMFLPSLTTYEMEGHALMSLAVGELIARIEKKYFEVPQRLMPCTLVERETTGAARND
jgi:DNA-binding LacI/PurR family transcriptional regulator